MEYSIIADLIPPITSFLNDYGLISLFVTSFLAATILPLGPEAMVAALVAAGETNFWGIVLSATIGGYLGSVTTYVLGYWGITKVTSRFSIIDPQKYKMASDFFEKYGAWSLLLSSVPIIGDALVFVSGALKYKFGMFSFLVFLGKFVRYILAALFFMYTLGGF
ncbi:YqaA family protein [Methanolapillus africanus]|uniref:YqaA family protein n=1 Tax=Methanolapillus africanus TaxID=3028297 RepID=UPI0030B8A7AE